MILTSSDISLWIGAYLWPFFRIGALFMLAPVLGNQMIPARLRLVGALAITIVIAPVIPAMEQVDPLSPAGILVTAQQMMIGAAMGFIFSIVFGAFIYGGQIIAMQMGLGFASLIDPDNGVQVPVLSQFYTLMVTLLFLSMNGHLLLVQVIVDSFRFMPISTDGISQQGIGEIIVWGATVFSGAVLISLPAVAALLVVNMAFGVMARAAPQLNIFAVGFPVTMTLGFIVLFLTLPAVLPQFGDLLLRAHGMSRTLLVGG